jgi:transposase
MDKYLKFFKNPKIVQQRQYEALRAFIVDKVSAKIVAERFNYSINTFYSLVRDFKSGRLNFFQNNITGPKERQIPESIQQLILQYRKENLSAKDIKIKLETQQQYICSVRTVERVLTDAKVPKLTRRTFAELGKTKKNTVVPERCAALDFEDLKPFCYDCPSIGVFFFLPYIIKSGIIDILKQCKLPSSSNITAEQACLSMLLLKLIGSERLSHINAYDHEPGFGVFAGLNFLPKSTFMATYSCLTSEKILSDFQQNILMFFRNKYPNFYKSKFINLDFHSIPHFGEQAKMEKVWCGARSKALKGANTIFAQDGESNAILYTRADILRKDETNEILKFISFWKTVKNRDINEILVFDCKLTTYNILDQINNDSIKFITLRKRNKKLLQETQNIPAKEWKKVYIPIPKRKHKSCLIYVSEIMLPKCSLPVRQIIVTNNGRANPTYIITNDKELSLANVLTVYAKRWHIEQKFAELVSFFNLNALSSPLMIRIHFDILWTVVADTLYHIFAQDLPRFENELATSIFRRFINMPGQIIYDGNNFVLKIRKRAHTPVLLGVKKLQQKIKIPWLGDRTMKIEWTP